MNRLSGIPDVTLLAPPIWRGEDERHPAPEVVPAAWNHILEMPCCIVKLMCQNSAKIVVVSTKVLLAITGEKVLIDDGFEVLDTAIRPQVYSQLIAELSS